jgi:pilus assembly protein CpaF
MTLQRIIQLRRFALNRMDREKMINEILDNMLGLGPLENLISDPQISDIMVNGADSVFIERRGKLHLTPVRFENNAHLMTVIERIVSAVGRRVDERSPMCDARMADGSRFNAIIPPLAIDGPCISIRRFGTVPIKADDLVRFGSCPAPMLEVLRGCVRARLNLIISGGTGSGKTTLLNVLSSFIPATERIITIEDSAELQLQQDHLVRLETRPANLEGKGKIDQRDLVKNALRMRPDRIILGEIRGGEAVDMLTAMNTGCAGSLATVHSNSPRDALARFETMVGIGMPNMSGKVIRETIARALDVIVQQARLVDGTRRITAITEVVGMEGPYITTQDIFEFEKEGITEDEKVQGTFRGTGVRPRFLSKLHGFGITLNEDLFHWEHKVVH